MTARSASDLAATIQAGIDSDSGEYSTQEAGEVALAEMRARLEAAEAQADRYRSAHAGLETQVAALTQERDAIGAALGEPCADCGHIDWRSDGYADDLVTRALADTRRALEKIEVCAESEDKDYEAALDDIARIARRALAATGDGTGQEQQP